MRVARHSTGAGVGQGRGDLVRVLPAALLTVAWAALVAASPPWFFAAAAPFCALWIAASALAAPGGLPGFGARLRPRAADVLLGLAAAALLFLAARAFLWLTCGGPSRALCGPLHDMFDRFATRGLWPGLVLALLVAPAEEAFWRGAVQARLATRLGRPAAAVGVATALAAAVALGSGEPFLALATVPAYATFGALAAWRGSLVPAIACHSAWTVLIAVVLPPVG